MNIVAPETVPPVNGVVNPVTLNVPPVLFVKVAILFEYVPPVTKISCGKFWYVVADIVFAVNPPVNIVAPVTVPPVKVPPVDKTLQEAFVSL